MDPLRADLHALGALPALPVSHGGDRREVSAAIVGHRGLAYSCSTWSARVPGVSVKVGVAAVIAVRCIGRQGLARAAGDRKSVVEGKTRDLAGCRNNEASR